MSDDIDWRPVDHAGDYAAAFNRGRALAARPPPAMPPRMNLQQLERAAQTNEQLGAILQSLQGLRRPDGTPDLGQRFSVARHIAQQSGLIDPRAITPQDVTDEGIDRHAAMVRAIQQRIGDSGSFGGRPAALASRGGPNVGDIEEGHRFLGGDPANPNSWRKGP
jgi:hypothetical protein